ncbi:syntaxin-binding protein 1 [Tremella mesenterica]|uniref:Syntaxin-binding protein 1 n=1 Tax=Tremella mesenterica TaxID=5217 RepID=A0A4Q1BCN8_TREME|nr:syntaxin-binding protein 1 [Tremella mesenterica]
MPLKDLLRARFTSALTSIPSGTWKILITDDHSQQLLDTVYKNYDILQLNVTSVEPLHSPRPPQNLDALYILTPTSQNVERIIADFSGGRRTYKSAHLYFIDGIDDRLAQRLTSNLPGDILQAFVELYCNFWAFEDRVFTMKLPSAFYSMYGPLGGAASADLALEAFGDDLKYAGRSILNLLATINENPYIRYYQPAHHQPLGPLANQATTSSLSPPAQQHPQSLRWRSAMGGSGSRAPEPVGEHLSKKIALQVQADLDEYMTNNPDFPTPSSRPRSVLIIVDRSMDPTAPLLHEFWYQAMVNDLLPVEDGTRYRYKYENTTGGKEEKEAVLNEDDAVWVSVRHLHMKEAIDTLMTNFQKFAQEHAGFRGGNQVNLNDLKDMLASLPQFQQQREQFSLHLDMAQECMALFEKKKLSQTASVEQCCATGFTAEGKTPKTLVEEMVPLLDDRNMSAVDKVRIIALYIIYREGVADEDRRRLYQHARLSLSEQTAIDNLIYLGVKVIKDAKDRSTKGRIKQKYHAAEGEYELSRYRPVVQMALEDHHANRLDQTLFPFVRDIPPELSNTLRGGAPPPPAPSSSLRSARPTWHKAPSARMTNTEGKQRMILFVAGGMTYSEMRLAYTVGQALGKEIFIGSTHITTAEDFVANLKSLGRGGIGAHPPNATQLHPQHPGRPARSPGRPATYQMILDQRHWVPPVGPPPLAPPTATTSMEAAHLFGPGKLSNKMSELSLGSKDGKGSLSKKKEDGEGKKKGLFKMKW